ncbi:phosphotransferase [uncultured Shimia sp.]|uniref:phosphotransferase enzyme family protein n=1 Tax=uncultured Shimia sp. TaxID=573152 RepID=UPI00262664AD|nr:phosphotransferase [uncultured Shimia sp.]
MNDDDALRYAELALENWGPASPPRLIKNRENAVFETYLADGTHAALRLHRPGYQTDNAIRSELWWAEALVVSGLSVPVPVRSLSGDVLASVPRAGRMASVVSWLDGAPMGEGDVPLPGSPDQQEAVHFALGAELARIHRASDDADLPAKFDRPVLDATALLGDTPAWGRFWENPTLSVAETETLLEVRSRLQNVIAGHAKNGGDFGLIHADALRENVLVQGQDVALIDFDDGVFGFRMYELGVAMSQNWDQSNRDALGAALLEGYATIRDLPADAKKLLEPFTVMRGLASCGWVIARYKPDDPVVRTYAERALEMCRRWAG